MGRGKGQGGEAGPKASWPGLHLQCYEDEDDGDGQGFANALQPQERVVKETHTDGVQLHVGTPACVWPTLRQ